MVASTVERSSTTETSSPEKSTTDRFSDKPSTASCLTILLDYPSPKGGVFARVTAKIRLTPKRIFVLERVGPIRYLRRTGTKHALSFTCPKVFDRQTGLPVGKVSGLRHWFLAPGELQKLPNENLT